MFNSVNFKWLDWLICFWTTYHHYLFEKAVNFELDIISRIFLESGEASFGAFELFGDKASEWCEMVLSESRASKQSISLKHLKLLLAFSL